MIKRFLHRFRSGAMHNPVTPTACTNTQPAAATPPTSSGNTAEPVKEEGFEPQPLPYDQRGRDRQRQRTANMVAEKVKAERTERSSHVYPTISGRREPEQRN
jgi:hypothetical protein